MDDNRSRKKTSDESVFGTVPQAEDLLNEERVQLSLYNEIDREGDKSKKKAKQEEDWSLRMTCTQEWFIRSSWTHKFLFLEILCKSTRGCYVLENVLKSIRHIFSKDVVESLLDDSSDYDYDRIPCDDDRALDETELESAMKDGFLWFVALEASSQIRVILRLLRLGGGGLVFRIYASAGKLFESRRKRDALVFSVPSLGSAGERESKRKIKRTSASPASKRSVDGKSVFGSDGGPGSEFTRQKLVQMARRESELLKYRKLRGISLEGSKVLKRGDSNETVDYLQILPIWLNRRIMSYIDDKGLSGFKKVGKYWGKMIDESINEKSGRKAINAKINKIVGIKIDKEERRNVEKGDQGEPEFVLELGIKELTKRRKNLQKGFVDSVEPYEEILSRKSTVTNLDTSFHRERCCAFDSVIGTLAGSNKSNMIHFYSVRTGARLNFSVFGLEVPVTCLTLHEDRIHVIVGCKNGRLIFKEIRTNKTRASINGHTMAVTGLLATSSNLLSASADNTVKYFQLWSGLCLLCVDLALEFNISSLLLRSDMPSVAAIGTAEGVLVMVHVKAKKFLKRVKLHAEEITQLAHDEDVLVTGSRGGRVRIWSMDRLEDGFPFLRPYCDLDVESSVSSLAYHSNQILCGCANGTIKIISLATGNITKTLKISSSTPILGLKISQDKLVVKLIIWHEGGIEIRTFSLKNPTRKDNRESKQKAPTETKQYKTSPTVLAGHVRESRGLIEVVPNRATFPRIKIPLKARCCSVSTLRTPSKKSRKFSADVFSRVLNESSPLDGDFFFKTFPRYVPDHPRDESKRKQ